ncbi:hypothetical protein [Rhizomicrobium electricum]|jgi:hypothetical protein|uniref:Uncharacterized protein n=1 Tax=Rhizomicrobium electricum TaxID=480070 RepID=A0ABP3Q6J3_9PROT|nr:hypothetical protein [Rhizomicrobium electricum]NIJ50304.1 hypothetical protein [Rhizomicrobium electricum]
MRLRAQIVVDIDADDYVEAAAHQNALKSYLEEIQARYPHAEMTMRERRERRHDGLALDTLEAPRPGAR